MAILRYICHKYEGKNGEKLYPGADDAMLSWEIDNACEDFNTDFTANFRWFYMVKAGTDEYDAKFTQLIVKDLPV